MIFSRRPILRAQPLLFRILSSLQFLSCISQHFSPYRVALAFYTTPSPIFIKQKMQQQNSGAMFSSPTITSARCHMSRDDKAVLESDDELKETVKEVPLKILGICGAIGSGKSYASSLLVSHHQCVAHINVDTLAHGVYSPGNPALEEIKREFNEVVDDDGIVNRADLGRIVFSDSDAMSKLERIVWPHVKTLLLQQISDIQISFKEEMQTKSSLNTSESVKKVQTWKG